MQPEQTLYFGPFGFDLHSGRLTREGADVSLGRTAAKVLAVLLTYRQQAVTQAEIRRAVWPSQVVDRGAVKGYISDLRAVLQDDPRTPRFIASVDGGYRFIDTVSTHSPAQRAARRAAVVGRDEILQSLHDLLDRALSGQRRFVFVTGEAGIGKTTTVEVFLEQAEEATHHLLTGRGQCVEHSGPGMAYLPVLEALERMCGSDAGPRVLAILRQHAPTWLAQLPAALAPDELDTLQRNVQGATQERRFRELARALEVLTAELPLLLWFEDLHWCDPETITLLSFLARRTEPARLCIIGTYRPVEVIVHQHPVKALTQELHAQGIGAILLLPFLPAAAIAAYVQQRFASGAQLPLQDLTHVLQRRTEGNPLFMVRVLDYAVAQRILTKSDDGWQLTATPGELETLFPASLRDLIAQQLAQVTDEERQVLEAASVVGEEFTLAEVAAALQLETDVVDQCCETLVRQRQLLQEGEPEHWPDGTVTVRARFGHVLYRGAIYEQLLPTRRLAWHGRIGARKAAAYGAHTEPIAAELAAHFAHAGKVQEAIRYYAQAGQVALHQQAHQVAVAQYTAGLELLTRLPDTPERAQQEVGLQIALGVALMATKGFTVPELEQAYARARTLCQQLGDTPQLFPALYGLWSFHLTRGELSTARTLGDQLLRLAQASHDAALLLEAHQALGLTLFFQGELVAAHAQLQQSFTLYDHSQHRSLAFLYGHDPGVVYLSYAMWTLWFLGFPAQALQRSQEGVALAREFMYAPSLSMALHFTAILHHWRGEWRAAQQCAEDVLTFATEQGLPYWVVQATVGRGCAFVGQGRDQEGSAQIRQGIDAFSAVGARIGGSGSLCILAEAYGNMGRVEEGLNVVAEALEFIQTTGERWYEAEVYRLKGQLTLQSQASLRQVNASQNKSEIPNTQHPAPKRRRKPKPAS